MAQSNSIFPLVFSLFSVLTAGCMIQGRIYNIDDPASSTSNTSKLIATPSALSLVTPTSSPNTVAAVTIRVLGVDIGATVKIFSDATCSTLLVEKMATANTADLNIIFTSDGIYTLYAQAQFDGQTSACSTQSVTYNLDRMVAKPVAASLTSPATFFEAIANPVIRVTSVEPGAVVKIYSDSICSIEMGSKTATAAIEDVPLALSATGWYSFFAQQRDAAGNLSECSTTNVEYQYAKSFNVTSSTTVTNPDAAINGICADGGGLCSLRAAFDEFAAAPMASPYIFNLEAGTYSVNTGFSVNYTWLKLRGASETTTILTGNGTSHAFKSTNISTYHLSIENMEVRNFTTSGSSQDIFGGANRVYSMKNTYIRNNVKPSGHVSAAILRTGNGLSKFENVLIENNTANSGEVLYINGDGEVNFKNVFFNGNAGWNTMRSTYAFLNFDNVTIKDSVTLSAITLNHSYGMKASNLIITGVPGTAIYAIQSSGLDLTIDLYNSTLFNNGVGTNGNLQLVLNMGSMTARIHNSIVAINAAKANCLKAGTSSASIVISSSYSFFDEASCGAGTGNLTGASPMLNTFSAASTYYGTLVPQVGSPAIDSGTNALCLASDITGLTRPIDKLGGGPKCDMGAIEVP